MPQDKADIATRLRQTRADMIGTDDEQHYWDCVEAAALIELLEAAHKASGSALAVIDGGFKNAVAEIDRLRAALVAVAEQHGTLSVSEGRLFVDVDGVETLAFDYPERTK